MAFFLMTQKAALDTSWMNLRPETLLDQTHQFCYANVRLQLACFGNEVHDFVGQLVSLFGAPLVRDQSGQPTLFEGGQSLIERRPRKAESRRGAGNRMAFALHAAQHLVLDLDEIPGIEEA